jgi:hypothetical protein
VAQALAAPHLVIYNAAGKPVHESGAWEGEPAVAEASVRSGFAPLNAGSRDAAAIVTLDPGAYTVSLSNERAANGRALLELISLP